MDILYVLDEDHGGLFCKNILGCGPIEGAYLKVGA